MGSLKDQLLPLSERIVDLSDSLDELEFEQSPQQKEQVFNELNSIGGRLLELLPDAGADDVAFIHFALGSVCSLTGSYEKAEQAYDEALKQWPDHVGILNEAFDILLELGKFEKARSFIERSIQHGGETPDMLYNYASLVSHMGDMDEARIILINALAKFPGDDGCKLLLRQLDEISHQNNPH
jgi:tetratricopeptide (TPR) repeat protein